MTENYIDIRHEYVGLPDTMGLRLRSVDVWYATKPNVPEYELVDDNGDALPMHQTRIATAWSLGKVGSDGILIHDRDDLAGLRVLLDHLEQAMDKADMADLTSEFEDELDTENKPE